MCVVSSIGDDWSRRIPDRYPQFFPTDSTYTVTIPAEVTTEDIEELRKEIESLKKLLKAAKIYDEETGQADCEMDEKVELIRRFAELVGVDIEDVFERKENTQ